MFTETEEPVSQLPPTVFRNLRYGCGCVVESNLGRDTTDVFKYGDHVFHETLSIFAAHQLAIPTVAVWKGKHQIFSLPVESVFVEPGGTKVSLPFSWVVY